MEIHEFLIFGQKSLQFPMDWDWRNGFKIRENDWSCIAVKLRVRRIPVCWTHLEFWETFDSFMYFCWMLHDVWSCGCWRMPRLYLQKGLSNRVIRAVSQRLERVLSMATGAGDRMEGAMDDARTRSRSPMGHQEPSGQVDQMAQ